MRTLRKLATAVAAALALAPMAAPAQDAAPVKIGIATFLSGPAASPFGVPARNAAEISELGKELHKRLADMAQHWSKLGKSLDRAVESYNAAVGSLEARVLPAARKFTELKVTEAEIEELGPLGKASRELQAPECAAAAGE